MPGSTIGEKLSLSKRKDFVSVVIVARTEQQCAFQSLNLHWHSLVTKEPSTEFNLVATNLCYLFSSGEVHC